jgi:rare lipoprotein A
LPIGSTVIVTNTSTGHSVNVRVNDRGPNVRGRSLDLSRRAAEEIGMTRKSVARVEIERVDSKPVSGEAPGPPESFVLDCASETMKGRNPGIRQKVTIEVNLCRSVLSESGEFRRVRYERSKSFCW